MTVAGIVKVVKNRPEGSVVVVATIVESKVIVMLAEGLKFEPETATDTPTIPEAGFRLIEGIAIVSVASPVRVPVPTSPVTVRLKLPPGVEVEVAIVSDVTVGLEELDGNRTGLLRVTVVLAGAPVKDRRMLLGSPVVVEPDESETVTV